MQVFEGEMRLDDAGGLHASPQHVLLRGNIVRLRDTIQRIQITVIVASKSCINLCIRNKLKEPHAVIGYIVSPHFTLS